jgi:hypothetical protein
VEGLIASLTCDRVTSGGFDLLVPEFGGGGDDDDDDVVVVVVVVHLHLHHHHHHHHHHNPFPRRGVVAWGVACAYHTVHAVRTVRALLRYRTLW